MSLFEQLDFKRMIGVTLAILGREFHFSKNHIINISVKLFGITPMAYLQRRRLQRC